MTNAQIVKLYEESNLDVETLAEAFELDTVAVKMALSSGSVKFRKELRKDDSLFEDQDLLEAKERMKQLMYCENDNTSFRAAKYVIDDKKGRHDKREQLSFNVNVNMVNIQMARAKKALEKSKTIEMGSQLMVA